MNTLEGNKLIAEFMGAEFKDVDYYGDGKLTTEIKYKDHPSALINGTARTFSNIKDLRYDYSWDWLMPVVEKIGKIYDSKELFDDALDLDIWNYSLFTPKEKVYDAVIQFIQWCNQNTKP